MCQNNNIQNALFTIVFLCSCFFSCRGKEECTITIDNPYADVDFTSVTRIVSTTHEHVTNQKALESYINRGVDVLCISNYSPAIPVLPITGFSRDYLDWMIAKDNNGHIQYEMDGDGSIKTIQVGEKKYKVPVLQRVKKTFSGGYSDFAKADGTMVQLYLMPQLPNSEHTHYYWQENTGLTATKHINFIGSSWAEVGNGCDDVDGIAQYNDENGYSLTSSGFRSLFPLWNINEMLDSVRNNLLFPGKVFGTINHPGYSGMSDRYIDAFMKIGGDIFKGMEIYNNSDTDGIKESNIDIYDRTLSRGYRLWCTAVNDWGNFKPEQSSYPANRGCNILYLNKSYDTQTINRKTEMVLDAYISGCFSAAGFGNLYIKDVSVDRKHISVSFNSLPDRTVIDIDGFRKEGGQMSTIEVDVSSSYRFVRFEAYKNDDFVYTNPFFVNVDYL